MIYCTKCGVELDADMTACPICGQPVLGKNRLPERIEAKEKRSTSRKKSILKKIKQFLIDHTPPFKRIFHV